MRIGFPTPFIALSDAQEIPITIAGFGCNAKPSSAPSTSSGGESIANTPVVAVVGVGKVGTGLLCHGEREDEEEEAQLEAEISKGGHLGVAMK